MAHTSNISIDVTLDEARVPENITWRATDSTADTVQAAKAMLLAFCDGADKSALRIDLWTKTMMVDEMADFYYQVFMTMADTFQRATNQTDLTREMKENAAAFLKKFKALQIENQS